MAPGRRRSMAEEPRMPRVRPQQTKALSCETPLAGAGRNVVGIESGVVSGVIKPRITGACAPARSPRHDERYHEACVFAACNRDFLWSFRLVRSDRTRDPRSG